MYDNFGLAIFFTAHCVNSFKSVEDLAEKFGFFEKHMKVSKVYLETHRDSMDVPAEKLIAFRDFFENKGIKASGAVTTTLPKSVKATHFFDTTGGFASNAVSSSAIPGDSNPEEETVTTWSTICYTDEDSRNKLQKICEFTAKIFDEYILDDFYFTSCTCKKCIAAKGSLSWEQYRLALMTDVSENVIIKPSKAVNPDVKVIIKYPNWYEAYQQTGYNTLTEPQIFDDIYTGTETRDPMHSKQHLPRYESYMIMRYMENIRPGHNKGGWMDWLDSDQSLNFYLEQAHLTLFAKGRELTLFCYGGIVNSVFVPALGFELEKLDRIIGKAGKPAGIPAYLPHNARGDEYHIVDYLGTAGIPMEPVPDFPDTKQLIFIPEDASCDPDIINKLKRHLAAGGDVCITSGFLKAMQGRGIEDLTSAGYTSQKATSDLYTIWERTCSFDQNFIHGRIVTVPFINFMNNSSDCIMSLVSGDNNFPLLIKDSYDEGIVYTLTIPDNYSDIYNYPNEILTAIRQLLSQNLGIYLEAKEKMCLFLYDNRTFITESFIGFSCCERIHIAGHALKLKDLRSGEILSPICESGGECIFNVCMVPLNYMAYEIIKD